MVSVLGDNTYEFPKEFPLKLRLKDMLEDSVDEKFYISNEQMGKIANWKAQQKPFEKVLGNESITQTITARGAGENHSGMVVYSPDNENTTNMQSQVENAVKCINGNVSRTVRAGGRGSVDRHSWDIVAEPVRLGGLYDTETSKHQAGAIWDKETIAPTVDTMQGGNRQPLITEEPFIVASRGRNPENPSDRTAGIYLEQTLEPNFSGCSNTLTTVQKDNYVAKPLALDEQNEYIRKDGTVGTLTTDGSSPKHNNRVIEIANDLRIRKLTPKECWRLMGFDDADFEKAATVNSNSQLYKQAGNSIVVDVLYYIFGMML